ncbi:MAG: lipoyl synthase [Acidobacteria bacterium]|nr:MAG: lipoyl synthase [Acidobacteriota bacterium]
MVTTTRSPRPDWLKVRLPSGDNYFRLKSTMRSLNLHTVCEEARCPNVAECWGQGTATFMILGDVCTRSCGFCAVKTGLPQILDREEPERVAKAVEALGLSHAVITSVNRDELPDGGAAIFAETIEAVRRRNPETNIEVLIPDFKGSRASLEAVLAAKPQILNHNIETVPRLYKHVRPGANFAQSVELLERAKTLSPDIISKTGLMVGLGESLDEVEDVMRELVVKARVDVFTIGQYLQPTREHLPIDRYVHPDEFDALAQKGREIGFRHVEAGPLVRSSYHAANQVP